MTSTSRTYVGMIVTPVGRDGIGSYVRMQPVGADGITDPASAMQHPTRAAALDAARAVAATIPGATASVLGAEHVVPAEVNA